MLAWAPRERQKLLSQTSRKRFEKARKNPALFDDTGELRFALLDFIADFANWDNSTIREYLNTSRALTRAAHEVLGDAPGDLGSCDSTCELFDTVGSAAFHKLVGKIFGLIVSDHRGYGPSLVPNDKGSKRYHLRGQTISAVQFTYRGLRA